MRMIGGILEPDNHNEQDRSKEADSETSSLNDSMMRLSKIQNTREKNQIGREEIISSVLDLPCGGT